MPTLRSIINYRKIKPYLFWGLIFAGMFGSITFTLPKYSLFQDSHDKAVQIHSLIQNGFQSENLFYPGEILDTKIEFFHLTDNLFLINKGRLLSAFPISFAVLSSPFYFLVGFKYLPYLSVIFSILTLVLLRLYWRFDFFFLFVSFFCTFAWPLSLDFSENNLISLIALVPLILLLRGKPNLKRNALAGLFLGFYVWFRLEGLIFAGAVLLFQGIGAISKYIHKKEYNGFLNYLSICISFAMILALFCAWNWFDYGHPLGTRYLANAQGFQTSINQRKEWIINLLFFGPLKIGYFGYLPAALILFCILSFHFRKLSEINRTLVGSSILFLVLVLITAPNDGFNNWGPRFFAPIILPYIILIRKFWFYLKRKRRKKIKFLIALCFTYSFLLGLIGLGIQRGRSLHVKKFSSIITSINADIWVYTDYLSFYTIGSYYLEKVVFTADTTEEAMAVLKRSPLYWKNRKIAFVQYDLSSIDSRAKDKIKKNNLGMAIVDPIIWDREILLPSLKESLTDFKVSKMGNYEIWSGILK